MKKNYHKTLIACYLGFITQAISANFAPLLFLTFHRTYHISLGKIAFISTVFFFTQLLVDLFCARYVDKIGYRRCVVASEILSACGLIELAFLPNILPNAYAGILLSAMIYAAGSGLIEVLVSPIVEACPFDNKDSVMSLLHSFYCWGSVGVILLSTAFWQFFVWNAGRSSHVSGLYFHCTIRLISFPARLNHSPEAKKDLPFVSCAVFPFSGFPLFLWSAPEQARFRWRNGLPLMPSLH